MRCSMLPFTTTRTTKWLSASCAPTTWYPNIATPRLRLQNFFIDDEVLASEGITDLDKYAVVPGTKEFIHDLFID